MSDLSVCPRYEEHEELDRLTEELLTLVRETRDSQFRTEKMVADFMTMIQNNPMLRAMGAKFGV